MAYRDLKIGDNVKVSDVEHEMHGAFGVVMDVNGRWSVVELENLGRTQGYSDMIHCDNLLIADRCVPRYDYSYNEHEEDDDQPSDSQIMQDLLQRVAKLEKEMLDMKQRQA